MTTKTMKPRKQDTDLLRMSRALRAVSELDTAELQYVAGRIDRLIANASVAPDDPDLFGK